jgi:hypothetical protein
MQVLQAGTYKLIYLELQPEMVTSIARQAGFETRAKDTPRVLQVDLIARERQSPLLLFDAADPANLGWFSRCQFYVEGRTGSVMQTPISLANKHDRSYHLLFNFLNALTQTGVALCGGGAVQALAGRIESVGLRQ